MLGLPFGYPSDTFRIEHIFTSTGTMMPVSLAQSPITSIIIPIIGSTYRKVGIIIPIALTLELRNGAASHPIGSKLPRHRCQARAAWPPETSVHLKITATALLPTTVPPFMGNRLALFAITLEATAN